jgi:alanyl-tRNA synthetase
MTATERLHYFDSLKLNLSARVVAHAAWNNAPSVILDRTVFYPESGGQMGDRGEIAGVPVIDVQVDDDGLVHHVLGGPLPAIGDEVTGLVDRGRRRVHMALHTGQHMLSRALEDVAHAPTVSSRLGESGCTIDVDRDPIDERLVARAEDLVNSVVDDDLDVRAFFPEPGELAALPLRRAPKVTENIRVVMIGDFDVSPCGGTHCARTGQVGIVRVLGVERYKGKARVLFSAGSRARRELWEQADLMKALGRELTCGPEGVKNAIDKLRREAVEAREALGRARARVAEAVAGELLGRAEALGNTHIIAVLEDGATDLLRAVAARITARPGTVAILAGRAPEGTHAMIARGEGAKLDCGALLKTIAAAAGGRGGGRPERAEGRLPSSIDWEASVAAALACLASPSPSRASP